MHPILFFVVVLIFFSCDYANAPAVQLVGKVYLWSMDGSNRKSLYYKTGESSYSMVDASGTVTTALANDSLIYLKCDLQQYPAWHLIKHKAGEKIMSIKDIDPTEFIQFEKSKRYKYTYYSK